jgi:hypothetical protein
MGQSRHFDRAPATSASLLQAVVFGGCHPGAEDHRNALSPRTHRHPSATRPRVRGQVSKVPKPEVSDTRLRPCRYSTEPHVSYQINRHGSTWSQCRDDCRRSIAAKIRKARREQPSRVASVRQDPNSAAPDALPIFRTLSHRQRFPSTMEAEERCPQLTDRL